MDIVRTLEDPKEAKERSVCLWSSEKDEKVVIFMKMENGGRGRNGAERAMDWEILYEGG